MLMGKPTTCRRWAPAPAPPAGLRRSTCRRRPSSRASSAAGSQGALVMLFATDHTGIIGRSRRILDLGRWPDRRSKYGGERGVDLGRIADARHAAGATRRPGPACRGRRRAGKPGAASARWGDRPGSAAARGGRRCGSGNGCPSRWCGRPARIPDLPRPPGCARRAGGSRRRRADTPAAGRTTVKASSASRSTGEVVGAVESSRRGRSRKRPGRIPTRPSPKPPTPKKAGMACVRGESGRVEGGPHADGQRQPGARHGLRERHRFELGSACGAGAGESGGETPT